MQVSLYSLLLYHFYFLITASSVPVPECPIITSVHYSSQFLPGTLNTCLVMR